MCTPHLRQAPPARGFTLVELLVGMALALITTVIIAQVVVNSEGQRRTTGSGADAQVSGSVGLYTLSRDIQGAGYGIISHSAALGCPIKAKYGSAATLSLTLAPVTITVDANGVPTLRTFSSSRTSFAVPMVVKANHAATDVSFTVTASTGVSGGDVMMAIPGTWSSTNGCTVFQVAASGTNVLTSTVIPNAPVSPGWNPATTASLMPSGGYPTDTSYLVNLGGIALREYTISSGNLILRELQSNGTWGADQVLASGIVAMRVMYGKDTTSPKDGVVDQFDTTTPTTADDWSRVLSVRIAVVARSEIREKEDTTTTADPVWDVGTATTVAGTSACSAGSARKCLTLTIPKASASDTEWKHYRYKVYDTVVPLRNVLWSAV